MNPLSILMFAFSGGLLLYAALLYLSKDVNMIPRSDAAKIADKRRYATQFAKVIALVALAPAYAGIVGLFSSFWGMVALFAQMILAIFLGTKLMK